MRMQHLWLSSFVAALAVLGNEAAWAQQPQRPAQPVQQKPAQPKPAPGSKSKNAPLPVIRNGKEGADKDRPDSDSLRGRLAQRSKVPDKDVDKLLKALGPAIMDMLQAGQSVEIEGLGSFRVVHVPAHLDLIDGRPGTVPAKSYVEFVPSGTVNTTVNEAGAEPAEVVPPFHYVPLPNQTPSLKVGSQRAPRVRTR